MDFESLRTSENKYKRYFYETIQECARRFELEEDTKNEIYETFMKKCEELAQKRGKKFLCKKFDPFHHHS